MEETSTDADVTLAVVRFLPDIERHAAKSNLSLARLYEALSACFDSPDDLYNFELQKKASEAAKTFIQVYWQRRCVYNKDAVSQELSLSTGIFPECSPELPDLYSLLEMVREILPKDERITVRSMAIIPPGISFPQLSWILHILLYRIWDLRRDRLDFPDFIYEFLRNSFSLPAVIDAPHEVLEQFLSNYLLAVALTVGLPINPQDLLVNDKRLDIELSVSTKLLILLSEKN